MKRLGFICAGVQKAGTTTLHALLRDHTDLELAAGKELHFFDDESRDWRSPDYSDYHRHFTDEGRVWGEITPIYIYMPGCLERIRAYNPEIRIVVLFRDPIDRAFSHWRMEVGRGWDSLPFARAIRDEGRRRVAENGWHRIFSYVERGFYGRQLAALFALFPRGNVLCLDYEAAMNGQVAVLKEIADFAGIRVLSLPTAPVHVHSGTDSFPSPTEADERYLASLYASDFTLFRTLSGLDCKAWRINRYLP